jgi:Icc-related predicted phosphoesterase
MKICCLSDIHGFLPAIPDCDLLLLAGDLVPITMHKPRLSAGWMQSNFRAWLFDLSKRMKVVGICGNHDFLFQERPDLVPTDLDWTYLQDSGAEFGGLKIWGTPWQPYFYDWAFNLYEPDLVKKWALIPENTDILVVHGPPHGYGDFSIHDQVHTGSPGLLERIEEIGPKLVVAGHIHSGRGLYNIGDTIFVNASYLDEKYKPTNDPMIIVEV